MPLRKRPQLTGVDYLIGTAERAAQNGQPFASVFLNMATDLVVGDDLLLASLQAKRALRPHEASPVAIIASAHALAIKNRDALAAEEILTVGLALLAKWPSYMASGADGHPDFDLRDKE